MFAAGATLLLVIVRLLLQTYSIFGMDEGITVNGVRIVALETQWGTGWWWQFGGALAAVLLTAVAFSSVAPLLLGAAALAVAATLPLTGHAVAEPGPTLSVLTQVVHVVGGGLWLGTLSLLFVFMFVGRKDHAPQHALWIQSFSPLALSGAALLMISGVVTTVRYVDFPTALWTTPYGGVLTAKIILVGLVVACGVYNWRRVRPQLTDPDSEADLRRWVTRELGFALLVLAVTAALVALPKEE
jgi:putative copper export protein